MNDATPEDVFLAMQQSWQWAADEITRLRSDLRYALLEIDSLRGKLVAAHDELRLRARTEKAEP